jgi:hypothetical protein
MFPLEQRHGAPARRATERSQRLTVLSLERPQSVPTTRKDVLPLTAEVTLPLWRRMTSTASSRVSDSSVPDITNVLPWNAMGWPSGGSCWSGGDAGRTGQ